MQHKQESALFQQHVLICSGHVQPRVTSDSLICSGRHGHSATSTHWCQQL